MSDEHLDLGFAEAGVRFESAAQNARVWTEQWVHHRLFCPNCGAIPMSRYANNAPVADFHCPACAEDYELKSSKRPFGPRVADGAFSAMCARIASPTFEKGTVYLIRPMARLRRRMTPERIK